MVRKRSVVKTGDEEKWKRVVWVGRWGRGRVESAKIEHLVRVLYHYN